MAALFGFHMPTFSFPGVSNDKLFDRVLENARAAERAGFDLVTVMDHFYQIRGIGPETEPMMEAYTTLSALAAQTSRIKLGTLVTGVTYRNPALLAKMVTTLDVISKGRAILGIGAAWYEEEHDGFGFDFPRAGERLDRLEEAVQICRALFRDERPTWKGRYYSITDARNVPRPVRDGGPPIMIGGSGERRTLRLVAQYGDLCKGSGGPATIAQKLDVLRGHCKDVGRDPAEIVTTRLGTLVLTDGPDETERTTGFLRGMAGDAFGEQFTVGEASAVVDQVGALVDAGLDGLIFNMPLSDPDTVTRAGELLTNAFA